MEGSLGARAGAAVGVVVASEGYPGAPATARRIDGAEPASAADDGSVLVFHAGTRRGSDGAYQSTGGRVVTVVGRGTDLAAARQAAYAGVADVRLAGGQYRPDIAERELPAGDGTDLDGQAG
jgi:phosphoribosylamine--glycine ligase